MPDQAETSIRAGLADNAPFPLHATAPGDREPGRRADGAVKRPDVVIAELDRQQRQAERLVGHAAPEPVEGGRQDRVVVEGQPERRGGRDPGGLLGVVAALDLGPGLARRRRMDN